MSNSLALATTSYSEKEFGYWNVCTNADSKSINFVWVYNLIQEKDDDRI